MMKSVVCCLVVGLVCGGSEEKEQEQSHVW